MTVFSIRNTKSDHDMRVTYFSMLLCATLLWSCAEQTTSPPAKSNTPVKAQMALTKDSLFAQHWYDGLAEVNRYALTQLRYGAHRQGEAVLIFVTETHDPNTHVKYNVPKSPTQPVLKLNHYRRFATGMYPYTMMTSVFTPVGAASSIVPTRIAHSMQEWCGQVYMLLDRWDETSFDLTVHSYFEGESAKTTLPAAITEDGLLNGIRINPTEFPTGTQKVIPPMHYLRFTHQPIAAYPAHLSITHKVYFPGDSSQPVDRFTIAYDDIQRQAHYYVSRQHPYRIVGWETFRGEQLDSRGVLTASERIPYWQYNAPADSSWVDSLGITTH